MAAGRWVEADAEAVARRAAEEIARSLAATPAGGRFHLALAGGTTPRRTYELLGARLGAGASATAALEIWFGDERCVAPDHAESNFAMARRAWLDALALPAERVHRMRGEAADRAAAAAEYAALLPPHLDLLLLGLGPDGHTASLFPGSPALREERRRVVDVVGPKPPPARLTITPPVIAAARRVLVVATGAEKAEAVRRAFAVAGDVAACPARLLRDADWILDAAAAGETGSGADASSGPARRG